MPAGDAIGEEVSGVSADKVTIVFLAGAAEELESHDEEDNADARACEGPLRGDSPGASDKARIDGIPIPKHLE